uniref:IS1-like element transposase n=1 Tax=Candidatus Enterovibrio escicola TaxID=1927127 RepID=UPI0037428A41
MFLCLTSEEIRYFLHAGRKDQIVELAMNNAGICDLSRVLHISINTVVRILENLDSSV